MLKGFYIEEKSKKIDKYIIFTALLMLLIIPIISYKYESLSISPIVMDNYYATGMKMDVFNFYKSLILYIGSGVIFSLFVYKVLYLDYKFKENKINIAVGIFAVGIILAAIFSDYKGIALLGNFDRHEGALAWFSYLMVFFVIYNIDIKIKYLKLFYVALYPFLIINAVLGVLNLYGYNVLKYDFIQMILGRNIGGTLWTTLYNQNFSSGICGVIFSLGFMYLLLESNIKKNIFIIIGNLLSFTIVLTSLSTSGFLAIVLSVPLVLIVAFKFSEKKKIVIDIIITMSINSMIFSILNYKDPSVFKESLGIFVQINQISNLIIPSIIILFVSALFVFKFTNKKKVLNYTIIATIVCICGSYTIYSYTLNKEAKAAEKNPKVSIVRMQDTALFQKLEIMSNGRAIIWQETIKLINKKPLVGQGFDTLPYTLDNDKQEGIYEKITIDKPHNIFLTVLYGSGIIGLLGFVGILIYIIRKSTYNLIDNKEDKIVYICLIGVVAYLVQGMLNDTFVGTSIIFWIIAGIGVNKLTSKDIINK